MYITDQTLESRILDLGNLKHNTQSIPVIPNGDKYPIRYFLYPAVIHGMYITFLEDIPDNASDYVVLHIMHTSASGTENRLSSMYLSDLSKHTPTQIHINSDFVCETDGQVYIVREDVNSPADMPKAVIDIYTS